MPFLTRILTLLVLNSALPLPAADPAPPAPPAESAPPVPAESLSRTITDAEVAFKAGDWERAIEKFEAITAAPDGRVSPELCHNLATAHFRAGHDASAALWMRRALALNPWLPETRQNLRFLSNKSGFLSFERSLAERLPRRFLIPAVTISAWAAALALLWLLWLTPRPGRRWPLAAALATALPILAAALAILVLKKRAIAPVSACEVVIAKDAAAFTAPAEASPSVISLPEGSEVLPIRTEGLWTYCTIPSPADQPLRGWIRSASLEKLWPWHATLAD
jgi:hypothetical protein